MNRIAKILSVVLALALVLGAIAIVSSADVAGITTKTANFDAMDPSYVISAAEGNPAGTGLGGWSMEDRAGTVSVGLSEDGQEIPNQYLVIAAAKGTAGSNPYWGTGYGGANLAGRPTAVSGVISNKGIDVADHPYLIMDLDVMSPTAKWSAAIGFQFRTFKAEMADGKDVEKPGLDICESDIGNKVAVSSIMFKTDENGTYIGDNTGEFKKYVSPYEFTRVTIILESVVRDDFRSVNLHVYVDGEHFFTHEGKDAAGGKGVDGYYAQTPNLSYDEIRFAWAPNLDESYTIGLDNVTTRFFDTKYEGNLAEILAAQDTLEGWDANTYDEANMPVGKAVAEVGDKMYESLDKAIAAAPENGTVKLVADVPGFTTVSKFVTIELNGYTAEVRPGDGFAVDTSVEGLLKLISSAGRTVEVYWDECLHEDTCEDNYDENHPLAFFDELAVGEKFFACYNPTFGGYIGENFYRLIGWKRIDSDELLTADDVVTEADLQEGFVFIEPVYEVAVKNYEYTSGGKLVTVFDGEKTFAQVIAAADAGTTVKLCSDIEWANKSTIDVGKKLTIDLNGYTLKACREGAPSSGTQAKTSLFRMTAGTDLTVTSSRLGGKIFNEGWNSGTGFGAAGVFNWNNDTAVLHINGNIDGKPALAIFSGCIIEAYSSAAEYYIDGGMYITVTGDQQGMIDVRKAGRDGELKNAFFYASGNGVFGYGGRNTATDDDAHITVDNCVFIGNFASGFVAPQVMTVTNSYIVGAVRCGVNDTYKTVTDGATKGQPNEPGTIILGDGNYIEGDVTGNVQYTDGVKLYEIPSTKDVTYLANTWKASANYTFDPSSFEVKEITKKLTFSKMTTSVAPKTVSIIWKDAAGKVIGTSEAMPGTEAAIPADIEASIELVPGWLVAAPAEWNESLIVPEGVDEYVITAKEGGKVAPIASVDLFMNIRLNTHFEYHVYVPMLADGIEITNIAFNNADRMGKYTSNYGKYRVGGTKFSMVDGWPGLASGASNTRFTMTFTYEGVEYTVNKDVNIIEYCSYILNFEPAEDQADYSLEARILAANTANYLYRGLVALGNSASDRVKPLVEEYADLIISIDDEAELSAADLTAVKDYITGTQLVVENYSVFMQFNLTDAGKAAGIKLSTGATSATDTEYAEKGYIRTNQTNIGSLKNVTVTVTPEGAEPIAVSFSLLDYYALLAANGANANTLALVEAMYGYAVANDKY